MATEDANKTTDYTDYTESGKAERAEDSTAPPVALSLRYSKTIKGLE